MKQTPIAILEHYRMTPLLEFVSEYTLVVNPLRGLPPVDISRQEAQAIIAERNLKRYTVMRDNDLTGAYTLGAVWDTEEQTFKRLYGPQWQPTRIRKHFRLWRVKDKKRKDEIRLWLDRVVTTYRRFLHKRIDRMFPGE